VFPTPIPGISVSHYMQGRLRLRVDKLKSAPAVSKQFEERLGVVHGMLHVEAKPLTGSLLLEFDPEQILTTQARDELVSALRDLFPEVDQEQVDKLLAKAFG
jgi:hypothetical protein